MTYPLWNDEPVRPLQNLKVLDFSQFISGSLLSRLLAQYGAEVLKIENKWGDPLRDNQPVFSLLNTGKKSVCVNFEKPAAIEIVKSLAAEADVLIENFPEGFLDALGLGYSNLSEVNPDLVYVSIRCFQGRRSNEEGYELNAIARSGCGEWWQAAATGPQQPWIAEVVGGAFAMGFRLLAHLNNVSRRGMHLVGSLEEAFRIFYLPFATENTKDNSPDAHFKKVKPAIQQFYECRDGQWLSFSPQHISHWEAFCEAVDRPAWKEDFLSEDIGGELKKLFLESPSSYWEALSEQKPFCLFRVLPWKEYLSVGQNVEVQLETKPFEWCGFLSNSYLKTCPKLGEDTFTALNRIGISNKELSEFLNQEVIKQT